MQQPKIPQTKLVFPVENFVAGQQILESGRCFGMCGEWALKSMSLGAVTSWKQLDEQKSKSNHFFVSFGQVNAAQKCYELEVKDEAKLLTSFYNLNICTTQLQGARGAWSKKKMLSVITETFEACPMNLPLVWGITNFSDRKNGGYGHAMAFRRFDVLPSKDHYCAHKIGYEFLDPIKGLWKSFHVEAMMEHISKWLLAEHSGLFPGASPSEISISFYQIQEVPSFITPKLDHISKIVYPFEHYLNATQPTPPSPEAAPPAPELTEQEIKANFSKDFVPEPSDKKLYVTILLRATDKKFQQAHKVPDTGNKITKLKFSDFSAIWGKFLEEASVAQMNDFRRIYQIEKPAKK